MFIELESKETVWLWLWYDMRGSEYISKSVKPKKGSNSHTKLEWFMLTLKEEIGVASTRYFYWGSDNTVARTAPRCRSTTKQSMRKRRYLATRATPSQSWWLSFMSINVGMCIVHNSSGGGMPWVSNICIHPQTYLSNMMMNFKVYEP